MNVFDGDKINFLLRASKFYTSYKALIFLGVLIVFLEKVIYGATPFVFREIINFLQIAYAGFDNGLVVFPIYLFSFYVILRVFDRIISEVNTIVSGKFVDRLKEDMTLRLFNHLHQVDLKLYSGGRAGALVRDVEKGIDAIAGSARVILFNVLPIFFEIIIVLSIFYYLYDSLIGHVLLFSVIVFLFCSIVFSKNQTKTSWDVVSLSREISSKFVDAVINFESSRVFGSSKYEMDRHKKDSEVLTKKIVRDRLYGVFSSSIKSAISTITICFILGFSIYSVANGAMLLGDLALINILLIRLHKPLDSAGGLYLSLGTFSLHIERLLNVLNVEPAIKESGYAKEIKEIKDVSVHDLSFSYDENKKTINNLSFSLTKGDSLSVVGPSGSGKSTISKVLLRLYDFDSGKYFLNKEAVENFTVDSIRERISIVSQDTTLFNDTLRKNITYGMSGVTDEAVNSVLKSVALNEVVDSLPLGLDTLVGERGTRLSGGEKQRVLLARAILRKPDVIIFDEATSALDKFSEEKIFEITRKLMEYSIVIIITHDLNSSLYSKKIMCFDEYGCAKFGSHQDLLLCSSSYKKLWDSTVSLSKATV